jgi:hypothetical protein
VDVTFHILGFLRRKRKRPSRSGFQQGNGGPPVIAWAFLDILDRFLKLGPNGPFAAFEEYADAIDREYSVKTINMNFITPTDLPDGADFIPVDVPVDQYRRLPPEYSEYPHKTQVMTSKHLAEFVAEVLQRFMHVDQFENYFETYGKLVATRVGEIRISVDGEPWKVLDIEASIRDLPRYNESWIQDILKLRAIFGLPIHVCDSGHSRTEA